MAKDLAKIFVGCVTFKGHEFAFKATLDALIRQSVLQNTLDWELHLIDTSEAVSGDKNYADVLKQQTSALSHNVVITEYARKIPKEPIFEIIANAREALRQEFLKSGCSHLFFLDDDVILPVNALSVLLSDLSLFNPSDVNSPDDISVVSGVYLNNMHIGDTTKIYPIAFVAVRNAEDSKETLCKPLLILDVIPERLIPVVITGLGCALIRREALSDTEFLYDASNKVTEDTPFFISLGKKGFRAFLDTRIKCAHLKFPIGDKRNSLFDFSNYKLSIRQK